MLQKKIKTLLSKIDTEINIIEKLGIKYAKRNGAVDDLDQKKSIDLATKITLHLIDHYYYDQAYNIVSKVCNMTLGPFKSAFVLVAADSFCAHQRYLEVTKMATLLASLKGELKIKTAKQLAIKLRNKNQIIHVNKIYESLQQNPTIYAQKAVNQIVNYKRKKPIDNYILLKNVKENLIQIESMGINCAKRGGSADDKAQKQAIDLATKIGLSLVKNGFYKSAFNVASCVCNISMGPFKAACAQAIATALIQNKQYDYAKQIALLTAKVKGKLKAETVKIIALKLKKENQHHYAIEIYKSLQKNPAQYAQQAAFDISNNIQEEALDINTLLKNVNQNLISLEKIGIKCARRGGSIDDPEQKKAIELATKIGIQLIQHSYYQSAFNIVENVCTIAMGPFKSHCAIKISKAFIDHKQTKFAVRVALLIALMKDKIIINTACEIASYLIKNNYISSAKKIYDLLKKNKDECILDIINQLNFLFLNHSKQGSPFVKRFNETTKNIQKKTSFKKNNSLKTIDIVSLKYNQISNSNVQFNTQDQVTSDNNLDTSELALAFQESFGSLIEDHQQCVSWSNKSFRSSLIDPFKLTLTHNDITYITGSEFNKITICFNLKTGKCSKNKISLSKEDIEKYTLIFFKIIDNESIYKNNFVVES